MEVMKQSHQISLYYLPKYLMEFSWETIWWSLIMFHLKYILFSSVLVNNDVRMSFSTSDTWGMSSIQLSNIVKLFSSGALNKFW
jgi:hypothetical protein